MLRIGKDRDFLGYLGRRALFSWWMDAVELPLPANVVVSKLLATEGFGRVGEPENRGSDGADAPVFGSHKLSGCSPYRGGTIFAL